MQIDVKSWNKGKKLAAIIILLSFVYLISRLYHGFLSLYARGYTNEPIFWVGVVFWSIFGWYFHGFKVALRKKRNLGIVFIISGVVFVNLATSGRFPQLYYFISFSTIGVLTALIRGVLADEPIST